MLPKNRSGAMMFCVGNKSRSVLLQGKTPLNRGGAAH